MGIGRGKDGDGFVMSPLSLNPYFVIWRLSETLQSNQQRKGKSTRETKRQSKRDWNKKAPVLDAGAILLKTLQCEEYITRLASRHSVKAEKLTGR